MSPSHVIGSIGSLFALVTLIGCGGAEQSPERTVTVYVSTDRVFSEPVLREY
jgi:hypothetical protein